VFGRRVQASVGLNGNLNGKAGLRPKAPRMLGRVGSDRVHASVIESIPRSRSPGQGMPEQTQGGFGVVGCAGRAGENVAACDHRLTGVEESARRRHAGDGDHPVDHGS